MKRVGAFEAKTHLSQLLNELERKQTGILIQRRGKDVAALVPCGDLAKSSKQPGRDEILAGLREIRASQRKRAQAGPAKRAKDYIRDGRKR